MQGAQRSFTDRMMGAAMLDVNVYEEVEHDDSATSQAAMVVVITAVAQGIGAAGQGNGGRGFIAGVLGALIAWWLGAGITYWVGTRFFGGTATWGEVARTLGFANSPLVLAVLGLVPGLGRIIIPILGIWVLIARIIAIRQALDFSTGKAILTALVGWLVAMLPVFLIFMLVIVGALLGGRAAQ